MSQRRGFTEIVGAVVAENGTDPASQRPQHPLDGLQFISADQLPVVDFDANLDAGIWLKKFFSSDLFNNHLSPTIALGLRQAVKDSLEEDHAYPAYVARVVRNYVDWLYSVRSS